MKDFKYTEPSCSSCDACNNRYYGNRYCEGGKRPRQFKCSDPKIKAPKWCPKRNTPPLVRVYDFKDDNAKTMHYLLSDAGKFILPSGYHYKLVFETKGFTNARHFYERTKCEPILQLIDFDVNLNNIVEIDDGLKPYYFYYQGYMKFANVYFTPPEDPDAKTKKSGKSGVNRSKKG